jgi:hypothetical protein
MKTSFLSLKSLKIKTQLLKRLQRVIVVYGPTHSKKDYVEANGGSLEDRAEAFMLSLCELSWFCSQESSQYLISMR